MRPAQSGVGDTVTAAAANITMGSWPDWLAAICTAAAALVAAFSYSHSVRLRREAQARLVYSRIDSYSTFGQDMTVVRRGPFIISSSAQDLVVSRKGLHTLGKVSKVDVHVHNDSPELIGPFRIRLGNQDGREIHTMYGDVLRPNHAAKWSVYFAPSEASGLSSVEAVLQFRDASSRWWQRHSLGAVRPVPRGQRRALRGVVTVDDEPEISDLTRAG